jgi:putative transcriptional regulator
LSSEVSNSLKVWRAKFDLTQSQLADKVSVSRKTINTLEREIYTPSVTLALKIARVFETTVEEVFNLKE